MNSKVRAASSDDVFRLVEVEADASQIFRSQAGLEWLAGQTACADSYLRLIAAGTVWVVIIEEVIAGFLAAQSEPPNLHIVEISVQREHQRRGLARTLVACVADEAKLRGFRALTLTTFRTVPWNAPYYSGLGFQLLEEPSLFPALRTHLEQEASRGLSAEERCAMMLPL